MMYNDGRPCAAELRRAYSCCAVCEGDNCNGGSAVAAASMSAPTISPRCGLIELVPISRAALPRASSQLRAHCPLFSPQTLKSVKRRHLDRLWLVLQALFDALSAAAALDSIRTILESTLLPFAACERVY